MHTSLVALASGCAMALALIAASVPVEARTEFPAEGGRGDASTPDQCPNGWYLIGFKGRAGAWIDQITLRCARFNAENSVAERRDLPARGGNGGGPIEIDCPRGSVVQAVSFSMTRDRKRVSRAVADCVPLSGGGSFPITFGTLQAEAAHTHKQACHPGDAAIGMRINHGKHVNATGLICDALVKLCPSGQVWRERFDGDTVCVHPNERWKMADGSCRQGYVKIGSGPRKDACGTAQEQKAQSEAILKASAIEREKLQSGNPQDFAGKWFTMRMGETFILDLQVNGNDVTGTFTSKSKPALSGSLTGTVKRYDGNHGPIVKLSYTSKQPTEADGSFDVSTDGKLQGGYTYREPGKAKRTYHRWNGYRVFE